MWVKKTCDSTIGSPKSKPWQYHNSARIQFTARCDVLRSEPPWSRNLNCWRDLVVHAASGSKVQAPSDWQAQMELYCTSYYLSFAPAASWPDYRGLPLLLQISSVTIRQSVARQAWNPWLKTVLQTWASVTLTSSYRLCLVLKIFSPNFTIHLSHQIFCLMHRALNVGK